jgi:hypothetical protein
MKLSNEEVLLLVNTINPTVEYYREVNESRFNALSALQVKLEDYHDAAMQLAHEANQD